MDKEKNGWRGVLRLLVELKDSYRLPFHLIPIPRDYSEAFLCKGEVGLPTEPAQGNIDLGTVALRGGFTYLQADRW